MFQNFKNTLYIRLEPENIRILHVESGYQLADIPALAIETRKNQAVVIAAGHDALLQADKPNVTIKNGFLHPRTLIADFTVAEQTLKYFVKKTLPKAIFSLSPTLVLHPLALLEGGLTQIEIRALAELGATAGARQVYVWMGESLSREALANLRFSDSNGQLLFP